MKKVIIYLSVLLLFLFVGLSPVYAGFEERMADYDRGDYEAAFKEIKLLAEQGNTYAQRMLGVMYKEGQGVPQDYTEAVIWFRKSAEQGNATAQSNLGTMYVKGQGVPIDYAMAYKWYNLAAAQGDKDAVKNRSILEKVMTSEQITEAQRLSREFKVKSPQSHETLGAI